MYDDDKQTGPFENKSTFIWFIEQETGLLNNFFINFQHYMLLARKGLRAKTEADPKADVKGLADKVLAERFSHSD
jgi:hypothetical protein